MTTVELEESIKEKLRAVLKNKREEYAGSNPGSGTKPECALKSSRYR